MRIRISALSVMMVLFIPTAGQAHFIMVNGNLTDWIGTSGTDAHSTRFDQHEVIYLGETGDSRTDPTTDDRFYDLTEFRLTWTHTDLYILVKYDLLSIQETHFCLSIDTDYSGLDTALSWHGDESKNVGSTPIASAALYGERQILIMGTGVSSWDLWLYADTGSAWYHPSHGYEVVLNETNKCIEARIPLVDLGLEMGDTFRLIGVTYDNNFQLGIIDPNAGDSTVDYVTCDGLDVIGGTIGSTANSWTRDFSDGDLDRHMIVTMTPPPVPSTGALGLLLLALTFSYFVRRR